MGFFEDLDEDIKQEIREEADTMFDDSEKSLVGAVIYYDPVAFQFIPASSNASTIINSKNIADWRTIIIGTVINDYGDNIVDVLMCGFLMANPLILPAMYYRDEKRRFIRGYAQSMFRRFVSSFFKQCPGYKDLLKLNIEMPTVSDMMKVNNMYPEIFQSLQDCSEYPKYIGYVNRMLTNYIYVMHKNKMYMMHIDGIKDSTPDVVIPDAEIDADFLCVFRKVDLNVKDELDSDKAEFFG